MQKRAGTVFTWGGGSSGELGHGKIEKDCGIPTPVPQLRNAIHVACGEACTAAVTKDGDLYVWGSGRGGRLGTGNEEVATTPVKVNGVKNVTEVSVGENHLGCVTCDGSVFTWGKNNHGALGNGTSGGSASHPTQVEKLPPDCVHICCGYQNTAVVTQEGAVYIWGANDHAKLGLGTPPSESQHTPTLLPGLPPVSMVALGSIYSAAVTKEGQLFTWGYGGGGNLGLGNRKSFSTPQLVVGLEGITVCHVACTVGQINPVTHGNAPGTENPHTLIITADGSAYGCGSCHKGMLGNHTDKILAPPHGDELLPYKIGDPTRDHPKDGPSGYLESAHCVQAVSAGIHSAVLAADGQLFCFGCGSTGRMGVRQYLVGLSGGKDRMKCYVSKPTAIEVFVEKGIQVAQMATSRRHMAAVCVI
eukprot:TRINITY_DN13022_c0_g1_i1.p1 TRINITY_DN13022_c0_g1~~TRINITY_DN13022_c0_g1_i1.p1  ORF type:complete len:429 (-),score=43.89 TRINITY_DN13022_c0_g1_i1:133-1383(-)